MTATPASRAAAIRARAEMHGIDVTTRAGAAELADRLGVHTATVYRALNGSTAPGPRFAAAYAAAFTGAALVDLYPDERAA